jgi:hypothetical protein
MVRRVLRYASGTDKGKLEGITQLVPYEIRHHSPHHDVIRTRDHDPRCAQTMSKEGGQSLATTLVSRLLPHEHNVVWLCPETAHRRRVSRHVVSSR